MSGTLFIVATPIGNLDDLTIRIRNVIEQSKFVLAEDTRVTIKILNHLGLKKQMLSCHEHNEEDRFRVLDDAAAANECVALISDAGTPLISDPGYQIVRQAIQLQMTVIPIAGPSAFLLALVGSGLPCDKFVFEGFLPDKSSAQKSRLLELESDNRTLIFYMSPHKLIKNLNAVLEVFGDRAACLARELTKKHEQFIRAPLSHLIEKYKHEEIRGEFVLVVAGKSEDAASEAVTEESVREAIRAELKNQRTVKDIAAILSDQFKWKKSDVYRLALDESTGDEKDS